MTTRATMTTRPLARPANLYASIPAAIERSRNVLKIGELESKLAAEDVGVRTRLIFAQQRERRLQIRNKIWMALTALSTAVAIGATLGLLRM